MGFGVSEIYYSPHIFLDDVPTTKDDLYEEIGVATAIKNSDGSKRAATEPEEQPDEKRNEGMAGE